MTTNAPGRSSSPALPRQGGMRIAVALLGVATVVVGVVLLFDPVGAARTLALLTGLALVLGGLLEFAVGWNSDRRWAAVVLAAVLIGGGLLAVVWPQITLGVVAVIVGVSLILHGAVRLGFAVTARAGLPNWGWLALAGAFNILVGLLALFWPQATVLVLALVLGAQVTVFGLLLLASAFWPRPRAGVAAAG